MKQQPSDTKLQNLTKQTEGKQRKPFTISELTANVKKLIEESKQQDSQSEVIPSQPVGRRAEYCFQTEGEEDKWYKGTVTSQVG